MRGDHFWTWSFPQLYSFLSLAAAYPPVRRIMWAQLAVVYSQMFVKTVFFLGWIVTEETLAHFIALELLFSTTCVYCIVSLKQTVYSCAVSPKLQPQPQNWSNTPVIRHYAVNLRSNNISLLQNCLWLKREWRIVTTAIGASWKACSNER